MAEIQAATAKMRLVQVAEEIIPVIAGDPNATLSRPGNLRYYGVKTSVVSPLSAHGAGQGILWFATDSVMSLEGFLHIVHPEDRAMLSRAVNEAILSEANNSAEYRIVHPDGSVRWTLSRGRPYPVPGSRMMGISIDITDRKIIEERILASEAYLAAAFDAVGLGFYAPGREIRLRGYSGPVHRGEKLQGSP